MSSSKKKTGLGTSAFFTPQADESDALSSPTEPVAEVKEKPAKPKKVRTTITLYPETLAAMELLKVNARRTGKKVTLSDVFAEAVDALMIQKGLSLDQLT